MIEQIVKYFIFLFRLLKETLFVLPRYSTLKLHIILIPMSLYTYLNNLEVIKMEKCKFFISFNNS